MKVRIISTGDVCEATIVDNPHAKSTADNLYRVDRDGYFAIYSNNDIEIIG